MPKTVLILGATGRFGRAADQAFTARGWTVRKATRKAGSGSGDISIDLSRPDTVASAAQGADVIVNALNPPYKRWAQDLPQITRAVIAAAKASGARILIPGNVYTYGADMPERLTATTRAAPTTRKGRLRVEMETAYRDAGVATLILRGGDFIEATATGNWFDSQIAKSLHKGIFTYPGPMDQVHAWAYLPDMARAGVALMEREDLPSYADIPFAGYTLTGAELKAAVQQVMGQSLKLRTTPWGAIRAVSLISPWLREVLEVRYLWNTPHGLDPAPLTSLLPGFVSTPLEAALRDALSWQNQIHPDKAVVTA